MPKTNVGTQLQLRPGTVRLKRRPRLDDFAYTGEYAYHVILVTVGRRPVFSPAGPAELSAYIADLHDVAQRLGFLLYAYCYMPDHVHLLVQGTEPTSGLLSFVKLFKQKTGYRFKQRTGLQLWQQSFFDRVLRRDESIEDVAEYIFANPAQAGLVLDHDAYSWSGGTLFARDAADGAKASSLRAGIVSDLKEI